MICNNVNNVFCCVGGANASVNALSLSSVIDWQIQECNTTTRKWADQFMKIIWNGWMDFCKLLCCFQMCSNNLTQPYSFQCIYGSCFRGGGKYLWQGYTPHVVSLLDILDDNEQCVLFCIGSAPWTDRFWEAVGFSLFWGFSVVMFLCLCKPLSEV